MKTPILITGQFCSGKSHIAEIIAMQTEHSIEHANAKEFIAFLSKLRTDNHYPHRGSIIIDECNKADTKKIILAFPDSILDNDEVQLILCSQEHVPGENLNNCNIVKLESTYNRTPD